MYRLILGCRFSNHHHRESWFRHIQRYSLVNVTLKWVKDRVLDGVVTGERELKAAWIIMSIIAANPDGCLPIYRLAGRQRGQLGLPHDLKVSTFIRKYPNIFDEFHVPDSGGTLVPWFRLTPGAITLNQEYIQVFQENRKDFLDRVCKLLMLTKDMILAIQTIDQLKWDLGLPHDYVDSFISNYKDVFSLTRLSDDRAGLKLLSWHKELAVSQLETDTISQQMEKDVITDRLSFRVGFPRGYGLKRKSLEWLKEWQTLRILYRTRIQVIWIHEPIFLKNESWACFMSFCILLFKRKPSDKNVSNFRKSLNLPQMFTKVFERHPGIFYISKKNNTQMVVLREFYDRDRLVHKHPVCEIRSKFACLMKEGFLGRSRWLYKKRTDTNSGENDELCHVYEVELCHVYEVESCENEVESEEEYDGYIFSEYESDETNETARLFKLCE